LNRPATLVNDSENIWIKVAKRLKRFPGNDLVGTWRHTGKDKMSGTICRHASKQLPAFSIALWNKDDNGISKNLVFFGRHRSFEGRSVCTYPQGQLSCLAIRDLKWIGKRVNAAESRFFQVEALRERGQGSAILTGSYIVQLKGRFPIDDG
jgi:hypothetical protein